jgi:hypothetical protein
MDGTTWLSKRQTIFRYNENNVVYLFICFSNTIGFYIKLNFIINLFIGTVVSMMGLICYYYVDKYNVLYRRTLKESISIDLTNEMI